MATRPVINKPDWFVSDSSKRVEPSGPKKTQGWLPNEPLPAQNENWLLYSISVWIEWLVEEMDNLVAGFKGALSNGVTILNEGEDYAIDSGDDGHTFLVDTSGALQPVFRMPVPADFAGMKFTVKDIGGALSTYPVAVDDTNGGRLEGLAAPYMLEADFGEWTWYCDGTDFWLV